MSLSGPIFEPAICETMQSIFKKGGAHYNIYSLKTEYSMDFLKKLFPEGEANDLNFVLFSTSGVHGTYITIEDIENSLKKYGDKEFDEAKEGYPDDYHSNYLTVLIVHPRIVCLRYGEVRVKLEDIPYLKNLRQSSWDVIKTIGVKHSE